MAKIFAVRDKVTNTVTKLVKAETKNQVIKHLVSRIDIEPVGAVDAVDIMSSGVTVEDASSTAAGSTEIENGDTKVATESTQEAAPQAAGEGATQNAVDSGQQES